MKGYTIVIRSAIESPLYSQLVQYPLVVAPVLAHFHKQAQEDPAAKQMFDLSSRRRADLFQPLPAAPDDYRAVRRALDVDHATDARDASRFLPRFREDCRN